MTADPHLAEEQEHLDRTFAAYDALLDALSVSRRWDGEDSDERATLLGAACGGRQWPCGRRGVIVPDAPHDDVAADLGPAAAEVEECSSRG